MITDSPDDHNDIGIVLLTLLVLTTLFFLDKSSLEPALNEMLDLIMIRY